MSRRVCKELIEYTIDPEKCDGCHACVRGCSVGAITGEVKKTHTLDKAKCVKCGACIEACKRDAISQVRPGATRHENHQSKNRRD